MKLYELIQRLQALEREHGGNLSVAVAVHRDELAPATEAKVVDPEHYWACEPGLVSGKPVVAIEVYR